MIGQIRGGFNGPKITEYFQRFQEFSLANSGTRRSNGFRHTPILELDLEISGTTLESTLLYIQLLFKP